MPFFFGRTDHESYTSNRAHENISNHVKDLVPVKTMCISSNIYFEELWCYSATFAKTHTLLFFIDNQENIDTEHARVETNNANFNQYT